MPQLVTGVQEDSLQAAQAYVAGLVATQQQITCAQNAAHARLHHHAEHGAARRRIATTTTGGALMERRIRRLGIFMVLCFVALFVQLNNIQILKAHALATSPNNPRVIQVDRNDPRGDILSADGVVLASSVPSTTGYYKYQRVYNPLTATLFSQIVGFDSDLTAPDRHRGRVQQLPPVPHPAGQDPAATC